MGPRTADDDRVIGRSQWEDTGIIKVPAAPCAARSVRDASERLRAQPAILHYKAQTKPASARRASGSLGVPADTALRKVGSCRAPHADRSSIPAFTQSRVGRAYTRETQSPRQLKPIPCALRPTQGSAKRRTLTQSWCRSSDSALPRGSSEPPTHTQDTDWRYSQSNCNPGKDTRWLMENVGASGTTQHRLVVLKRWKAYVTWCSGDLRGQLLLACTDGRMP